MNETELKLEYHKKAIGKEVYVVTRRGFWYGIVTDVFGNEGFLVKPNENNEKPIPVSIWDVRYPDTVDS